jgi:hypothetical protein
VAVIELADGGWFEGGVCKSCIHKVDILVRWSSRDVRVIQNEFAVYLGKVSAL